MPTARPTIQAKRIQTHPRPDPGRVADARPCGSRRTVGDIPGDKRTFVADRPPDPQRPVPTTAQLRPSRARTTCRLSIGIGLLVIVLVVVDSGL